MCAADLLRHRHRVSREMVGVWLLTGLPCESTISAGAGSILASLAILSQLWFQKLCLDFRHCSVATARFDFDRLAARCSWDLMVAVFPQCNAVIW